MNRWRLAFNGPDAIKAMRTEAQRRLDLEGEDCRQKLVDELQTLKLDLESDGVDEERLEEINLVCDHIVGWCNPRYALQPGKTPY